MARKAWKTKTSNWRSIFTSSPLRLMWRSRLTTSSHIGNFCSSTVNSRTTRFGAAQLDLLATNQAPTSWLWKKISSCHLWATSPCLTVSSSANSRLAKQACPKWHIPAKGATNRMQALACRASFRRILSLTQPRWRAKTQWKLSIWRARHLKTKCEKRTRYAIHTPTHPSTWCHHQHLNSTFSFSISATKKSPSRKRSKHRTCSSNWSHSLRLVLRKFRRTAAFQTPWFQRARVAT